MASKLNVSFYSPGQQVANRSETMKREIEELAKFCSYMMGWLNRQATSLKSVGIDKDVHIMSGTEFVASLSLDGYGPEKLTDIKAIIDYIFNEQMESEWADKEKNQVFFWPVFFIPYLQSN
jgi:hypothetical protein